MTTYKYHIEQGDHVPLDCIRGAIGALHGRGKVAVVRVEEYKPARSLSQNAVLHQWFGEIAEHTGHSAEEIKQILKNEYGVQTFCTFELNRYYYIRQSTAKYTREEMATFMDRVQAWAADFGITLTQPIPDHQRAGP